MAERSRAARAPDRRRPGGRSSRIRQAVRRATLELLAEKGFAEITLPAVALRAVIAMGHADATLVEWVDRFWKPREREWRSPIERAIERGELSAAARAVPLVELVAGPLLLSHLATRRPLSRNALAALVATVASGVKALYGR